MTGPHIITITFPSYVTVTWVLENRHLFITVAGSQGHGIRTCHLPSQLLISKVNGGSWIHLTIAAKKIIKLGNCMAASLTNRGSSPNYGHKSRTICIVQCCSFSESIFLVSEHKNISFKNNSNLWQILQSNHFSNYCFKNPMSS